MIPNPPNPMAGIYGQIGLRPDNSPAIVDGIIEAVTIAAESYRETHKLQGATIIISVPYDPQLRESWNLAEMSLQNAGKPGEAPLYRFDWSKWDVLTVPRPDGTGLPPEWLAQPTARVAKIPAWARDQVLTVDELRRLGAEALAAAEWLQDYSPITDEFGGGL